MQVTVTIEPTPGSSYGIPAGDWRIEVARAHPDTGMPDDAPLVYVGRRPDNAFDLVEGETYHVRAVRLDVNGAGLGPVIGYSFTAVPNLALTDVAGSIWVAS